MVRGYTRAGCSWRVRVTMEAIPKKTRWTRLSCVRGFIFWLAQNTSHQAKCQRQHDAHDDPHEKTEYIPFFWRGTAIKPPGTI